MAARKGTGTKKGRAPARRARPVVFPKVTKRREDLGDGKSRTIYRLRIPKELRDLPAKEQVKKLAELVKEKHGTGKRDYKRQHFLFTFTGTEYSPYTKKKIGKGTYGTGAKANLTEARREIESRIKAVKEGSTAGGSPQLPSVKAQGYGVFRNGPFEIDAIVMESAGPAPLPSRKDARKPHGRGQVARGVAHRRNIRKAAKKRSAAAKAEHARRSAAARKGWETRRKKLRRKRR